MDEADELQFDLMPAHEARRAAIERGWDERTRNRRRRYRTVAALIQRIIRTADLPPKARSIALNLAKDSEWG